ncbi:MAG TPA: DUF3108 domain-containing protein [Usitatibacter sp.]|nr:DUF3108 domain-containing protein [Usitatibacter sp.]
MRALLAALLLAATSALASAAPATITAEYELTNHGIRIGRVSETYVRKGDTYSIQSVTRSEGPLKLFLDDQLTVESAGTVSPEGLKPMRFTQRREKDPKRDIDASFDWGRGLLVSRFRGETHEVALLPQTQDRLSFMYQFMNVTPRAGPMSLVMSNGRKVERYTYRLVSEARLATPAGEFDTLHFERVVESPKESRAEVWLARDRFNFPVRVVFDDPRGLRVEQTLLSLQAR